MQTDCNKLNIMYKISVEELKEKKTYLLKISDKIVTGKIKIKNKKINLHRSNKDPEERM